MLKFNRAQSGVTLVELIIGLVIVGILLAMAGPSFSGWIRNSRVRTTTESIQNGLQLARAEAVRRNAVVRFQLTTTVANDCAISAAGINWVISLDDPTNLCATGPSDTIAPRIIQLRPATQGSKLATVASAEIVVAPQVALYVGVVRFNGLGQLLTVPPLPAGSAAAVNAGNNVQFDVTYPGGGTVRNLRVVLGSGGQVRMCDPNLVAPDAQAC